jgi:hypothetical protein
MSRFLIWLIFLCAALLLEWHSHSVLLWHSHVSLHMAQCHWGVTHNNKVIFCCFLCRTIFWETSESNALLLLSCPQWWVQKVQEQVELISTTMSYLVMRTTLLQACICDHVFHCRNLHLSVCWYGCPGCWQMEDEQNQVQFFADFLCWSLLHSSGG